MSKLKNRVGKLEDQSGGGIVIFIVDEFRAGQEPDVIEAWVGGETITRTDGEGAEEFRNRANPKGLPFADLEADVRNL